MKMKSLYIFGLQMVLSLLQLVQIHAVMELPISIAAIVIVMIAGSSYGLIVEEYRTDKNRWLFYLIDLLTLAIILFICLGPLSNIISIVKQSYESSNLLLLNRLSRVASGEESLSFLFLLAEYWIFKKNAKSMLLGDNLVFPTVISLFIFLVALIAGKSIVYVLIGMFAVNVWLLLLNSVQNPLYQFKKKVFIPVTCALLAACLVGGMLTPVFGEPGANLISSVIRMGLNGIEFISDLLNVDTPELVYEAEEFFMTGVVHLGSFEEEAEKQQERIENQGVLVQGELSEINGSGSGDKEDFPESENKIDVEDLPDLTPSGESSGSSGGQCESCGKGISSGSQCEECSGSGNKKDGTSNEKKVSPGLGNGQLTNASMSMPEPEVVLIVESKKPITHLKAYSGGNYSPETFTFETDTSSEMSQAIREISQILPIGYSFQSLFNRDISDNPVTITNVGAKKVVYIPYGVVNFNKLVSLTGDNYYSMYMPWDYNEYTVYFNDEGMFSSDSVLSEAITLYERAVYENYLQVPESMKGTLQAFLSSKGIDYTSTNKAELIFKIKSMLQNEYTYSLEPGELPEGEEIITYFLTQNKKGYCIHFASAATLLYRVCGIPARFVSGYSVPPLYMRMSKVMNTNAHAWTEVYQSNRGWVAVEVTAPGEGNSNSEDPDRIDYKELTEFETPDDDAIQKKVAEETTSQNNSGSNSNSSEPNTTENKESKSDETKESENDSAETDEKEEETPEDESEDESETESEEETEEDPTLDFKDESEDLLGTLFMILGVVLALLTVIGVAIAYILYKRKRERMTLEDQIYECYDLLSKYHYVTDEIYDMMLRIRFSQYPATNDDLELLTSRKNQLIQDIIQNEKPIKRLFIQLRDRLPVWFQAKSK